MQYFPSPPVPINCSSDFKKPLVLLLHQSQYRFQNSSHSSRTLLAVPMSKYLPDYLPELIPLGNGDIIHGNNNDNGDGNGNNGGNDNDSDSHNYNGDHSEERCDNSDGCGDGVGSGGGSGGKDGVDDGCRRSSGVGWTASD